MKALLKVAKGPGHLEVKEIPEPVITEDLNVLIEVRAAGVCGTDIHIYHDKFQNYPPVVLGHEFSGVVKEVGKNVKHIKVGDRVVGEPHTLACGTCELCRKGMIQICIEKRSPGWGINGAFTDFLVMPEKLLHVIPDDLPDNVAALAEPMAIVTNHVLERGPVEPMDFVAVIGSGPIGILSAFVAKAGGASQTVIFGVDADEPLRFKIARELGVDHTINIQKENAVEAINRLTHGRGADLVVEASGAEGGINSAIDVVRKTGRITVVGMTGKEKVNIKWETLITKMCDVKFNLSSSYTAWDRALTIMDNSQYDLTKIITHQGSIDDWELIFSDIEKGHAVKAMFLPDSNRG